MTTILSTGQKGPGFFGTLRAAFERACLESASLERDFKIGPFSFRLRLASAVLAEQMTRALEHLASPSVDKPGLSVLMWDDVTTGTQLPPLPWQFQTAHPALERIGVRSLRRIVRNARRGAPTIRNETARPGLERIGVRSLQQQR